MLNTKYALSEQIDNYQAAEYNDNKYLFEWRDYIVDDIVIKYKNENNKNIITKVYDEEDEIDCYDDLIGETFETDEDLKRLYKSQIINHHIEINNFTYTQVEFYSIHIESLEELKIIYAELEIVYITNKAYKVKDYYKFMQNHSYFKYDGIATLMEQSYVNKLIE